MHAFRNRIDGGLCRADGKRIETVVLLDGSEATLNADFTLVIADHHKALGIAGIFGGEHSGVNGETQMCCWVCVL